MCFRLEEPDADASDTAPWTLRFLLQDRADPSLLIPAADAWNANRSLANVFQARAVNPRELILYALGHAVCLFPRIESGLKQSAPTGVELSLEEAFDFLLTRAPALEQAGIAVILPGWWSAKNKNKGLAVRARIKTPRGENARSLSMSDLVRVDWSAALGDEVLDAGERPEEAPAAQPLAADPKVFWQGGELPEGFWTFGKPSRIAAPLLLQLGNLPFWHGRVDMVEALQDVYIAAAAAGQRVFDGQAPCPEKQADAVSDHIS